jgi:HlyD family secretion protein
MRPGRFSSKRATYGVWLALWTLLMIAAVSGILRVRASVSTMAAQAPPQSHPVSQEGVGCLGHIEPGDGIVRVAAPYSAGRVPVVRRLPVREGDLVRKGQLLAELDSRSERESSLRQSTARVAVARSRLAQVQAGPKTGDVAAQRGEIAQAETRLAQARDELQRAEKLRQTDDVTASELTAKRSAVQLAEQALSSAKSRLASLSEVRESDVNVARAELDAALADEAGARTLLAESVVYSPLRGRVLRVFARAGEQPGAQGLLELAETERMYAVAEVYENDIARVRTGQKAVISGNLLAQPVAGVVETVGREVTRLSALPDDPVQFTDGRVFRVRIRLNDPDRVAGLIHAKVSIRIEP